MRSMSPDVFTISRRRSMACRFADSATPFIPVAEVEGAASIVGFEKPAPSLNTRSTTSFGPPRPTPLAEPPPWERSARMFASIHRRVSLCIEFASGSWVARSLPAIHSPTTKIPRISPSPVLLPEPPSLRLVIPQEASQSFRTPSPSYGMFSLSKMDCILATTELMAGLRT